MFARTKHAMVAGALLLSGLVASAVAGPTWTALAESEKPFEIVRSEAAVEAAPGRINPVQGGDRVVAGETMVRVRMGEGVMLVLDPKASASVTGENAVTLESGLMAVGFESGKNVAAHVDNLVLTPVYDKSEQVVPAGTAAAPLALVASKVSDEVIELASMNGNLIVSRAADGSRVAMVGVNETLQLAKDALGNWNPMAVPAKIQTEGGAEGTQGESGDSNNDKAGVLLLGAGAVAGAAVLGGRYLYEDKRDDDHRDQVNDNKDNEFAPPSSGIGGF